ERRDGRRPENEEPDFHVTPRSVCGHALLDPKMNRRDRLGGRRRATVVGRPASPSKLPTHMSPTFVAQIALAAEEPAVLVGDVALVVGPDARPEPEWASIRLPDPQRVVEARAA